MDQRYILCIGAHPDDSELNVGGMAALLRARGDIVRFVSVTNGDSGHFAAKYAADRAALAARRIAEGEEAAAIIGAEFETLGVHDGEVYVDRATTEAVVRCIRSFGPAGKGPDLVLLNRPVDYHRDHRYTAQLVLDATYMLTVPIMCPETRHLDRMPVFAYWHDDFREAQAFRADVVVPVDSVFEAKVDMACAHVSQVFEWLPYNFGRLHEVPAAADAEGRRKMVAGWIGERDGKRARGVAAGATAATEVAARAVEAFQICEYGRVPDRNEIREIFPPEAIIRPE